MTTNTNGLPELLSEVREAAELCEPTRAEHTHATTVRCMNAQCNWTGDLEVALAASHGLAICPECDERNLRTVPSACTCGHTNTNDNSKTETR